jgi:hypothetical protein
VLRPSRADNILATLWLCVGSNDVIKFGLVRYIYSRLWTENTDVEQLAIYSMLWAHENYSSTSCVELSFKMSRAARSQQRMTSLFWIIDKLFHHTRKLCTNHENILENIKLLDLSKSHSQRIATKSLHFENIALDHGFPLTTNDRLGS